MRAEHRTPAVALLYAVTYCHKSPDEAADGIRRALGRHTIDGLLWRTAMAEAEAIVDRPGGWIVDQNDQH